MSTPTSHDDAVKKVGSLIKGIQIAMLTTIEPDKSLRSRPMATQQAEFDGTLWFFTRVDSGKVHEIDAESEVNVSYAHPGKQHYVSISGTASLVQDPAKNKELWSPLLKAWFPAGLEDPTLALLRVDVDKAEYWDSPSSTVVKVVGFLKAMATGKPYAGGDHEKVTM